MNFSPTAFWTVDRDGENLCEIVSPEKLAEALGDTGCGYPSVTFAQIEWLPDRFDAVLLASNR